MNYYQYRNNFKKEKRPIKIYSLENDTQKERDNIKDLILKDRFINGQSISSVEVISSQLENCFKIIAKQGVHQTEILSSKDYDFIKKVYNGIIADSNGIDIEELINKSSIKEQPVVKRTRKKKSDINAGKE